MNNVKQEIRFVYTILWERSDSVAEIKRLQARASKEALCCVIELSTLSKLVLVQPRKRPKMSEQLLNGARSIDWYTEPNIMSSVFTPDRRQSKTLILSTNVDKNC